MARVCISAVLALAALIAGCGGGGGGDSTASKSTPTAPPSAQQKPPADPTAPPASVPQKATGPADKASVKVIKGWSRTLRSGNIPRAARFFSLPSKFQNATPVLTIDRQAERVAINESLTCGAVPVKTGGAGRFTIVTFRLVERRGGDCTGAVGSEARSAIRVVGGQIHEWYRLPDNPDDSGSNLDGSTPVV